MRLIVTGGAGFIGSAVCRHLIADKDAEVINVDKLTHAGNLESLGNAGSRDWLYVEDHAKALSLILKKGQPGETYNVGGRNECTNLEVVKGICSALDQLNPDGVPDARHITFVTDRPGHDHRYAIDATKLERELGWKAKETFATGLTKTVQWYLENECGGLLCGRKFIPARESASSTQDRRLQLSTPGFRFALPWAESSLSSNFFVATPDPTSITKAVLIRTGAVTHFLRSKDQNTRYNAGIPSVAPFVQLH